MKLAQHPRNLRRSLISLGAAAALAAGAVVGQGSGIPATAAGTIGMTELQTAFAGGCTSTPEQPAVVTLDQDVTEASSLNISCDARIDLAGYDLTLSSIAIAPGESLDVTDTTSSPGLLTVRPDFGVAGIRTTGAVFTTHGRARVAAAAQMYSAAIGGEMGSAGGTVEFHDDSVIVAEGGLQAAGIGGGNSGAGGVTLVDDRATVTATGGLSGSGIGGGRNGHGGSTTIRGGVVTAIGSQAAPVGPGTTSTSSTAYSPLRVEGGTLHLDGAPQSVPATSTVDSPLFYIGPGGTVRGAASNLFRLDGRGILMNEGTLLVPADKQQVKVAGNNYQVKFDLNGASGTAPADVSVLADTFQLGERTFPGNPTNFFGHQFLGWNTARDGSGTALDAPALLPGASTTGAPVVISAYAQWEQEPPNLEGCTDGTTYQLTEDFVDPLHEVAVECTAKIDLNGHALSIRNILIGADSLEITDTSTAGPPGLLTVDASEVDVMTQPLTGIYISSGTLTISRRAQVLAYGSPRAPGIGGMHTNPTGALVTAGTSVTTAYGGEGGAGIGGGTNGGGIKIDVTGGTVTAVPGTGADPVGPGAGGSNAKKITVSTGTLRLPSGAQHVPATSTVADPLFEIGTQGKVTGGDSSSAALTGTGVVANHGALTLTDVTANVVDRHYDVSFDLADGGAGTAPSPVIVYAGSFAEGQRTLPAPTRRGRTFTGWTVGPAGGRTPLTASTRLPANTDPGGAPVALTAYATWSAYSLGADVAGCTDGTTIKLEADATMPTQDLPVGCDLTIDLNGYDVTARSVLISSGKTFNLTDTSTSGDAGLLTADASTVDGAAGIRTTGATFTTHGRARVLAIGGADGAGIGGRRNDGGGVTRLGGGAVTAIPGASTTGPGASPVGPGAGATGLGAVTVAVTLRLPSGTQMVPITSTVEAPLFEITTTGTVTGGDSSSAALTGGGVVVNHGTLTLADVDAKVVDRHYRVSFELNDGSTGTVSPVTVYARSFADGIRTLPTPTSPGRTFQGWTVEIGGEVPLTINTVLPANPATDGSALELTATAVWSDYSLTDDLGACTGTRTVTIQEDLVTGPVRVTCDATLDLNGHEVATEGVVIDAGLTLAVTDTSTGGSPGTLTADAGSVAGMAGVQNTDATFTVDGRANVVAVGGARAAGIGGGEDEAGGTTTVLGGIVSATPGSPGGGDATVPSPVGGGSDSSGDSGAVTVSRGTLLLPSGVQSVPVASTAAAPLFTIGADGTVAGDDGSSASLVGDGVVVNHGALTLTDVHTKVVDRHYEIGFDLNGASGSAPATVTVYAPTLAEGARVLPTAPRRSGYRFAGWNTQADGTGDPISPTGILPGSSAGGDAVAITAYAIWKRLPTGVVQPALLPDAALAVAGDARVGATLTASAAAVGIDGLTAAWRWETRAPGEANWITIDGATGSTFTPRAEHLGHDVRVSLTRSAPGYVTRTDHVSRRVRKGILPRPDRTLTVHGSQQVGATLRVAGLDEYRDQLPAQARLDFTWRADGSRIAGARSSTYVVRPATADARLTVRVSVKAPGYRVRHLVVARPGR